MHLISMSTVVTIPVGKKSNSSTKGEANQNRPSTHRRHQHWENLGLKGHCGRLIDSKVLRDVSFTKANNDFVECRL